MCSVAVGPTSVFGRRSTRLRRRCEMTDSLNRRDFIKLIGAAGGALVLAVYLDACTPEVTGTPTVVLPTSTGTPEPRPPYEWAPNIYLKLDQDGILTVT